MLEIIKPSMPVLIEDLGTQYATATSARKHRFGIYKCHCGIEFRAQTNAVKIGNTNSCGCYNKKRVKDTNVTHGLSSHILYKVMANMVDRTTNVNGQDYDYYGARGIIVCEEWRNDFMSFYNWAIENGYKQGLTIDRRNNDGNYEPSNCRWVSRKIQSRNTRKLCSLNTSGYRGVTFYKNNNKWIAQIGLGSGQKKLGYFYTALEAAKAYDTYVIDNNLEHTINGVLFSSII